MKISIYICGNNKNGLRLWYVYGLIGKTIAERHCPLLWHFCWFW